MALKPTPCDKWAAHGRKPYWCTGSEGDEHTCPYRVEMDDDHETLCNCCEDCACECAMDV